MSACGPFHPHKSPLEAEYLLYCKSVSAINKTPHIWFKIQNDPETSSVLNGLDLYNDKLILEEMC